MLTLSSLSNSNKHIVLSRLNAPVSSEGCSTKDPKAQPAPNLTILILQLFFFYRKCSSRHARPAGGSVTISGRYRASASTKRRRGRILAPRLRLLSCSWHTCRTVRSVLHEDDLWRLFPAEWCSAGDAGFMLHFNKTRGCWYNAIASKEKLIRSLDGSGSRGGFVHY